MNYIMKKILTQQFMGVLAGLASIILSVTLYAYKSDQQNLEIKIKNETINRIESDQEIKQSLENKMKEHEEKDAIRFEGFEKDLKETKDMVKYLYERELNKGL